MHSLGLVGAPRLGVAAAAKAEKETFCDFWDLSVVRSSCLDLERWLFVGPGDV